MSKMSVRRIGKSRRGQGMTEYIIIVALIAIAAVGVVTLFGNNIRKMFGASANVLAGSDTGTSRLMSNATGENKHLVNFEQNNNTWGST